MEQCSGVFGSEKKDPSGPKWGHVNNDVHFDVHDDIPGFPRNLEFPRLNPAKMGRTGLFCVPSGP